MSHLKAISFGKDDSCMSDSCFLHLLNFQAIDDWLVNRHTQRMYNSSGVMLVEVKMFNEGGKYEGKRLISGAAASQIAAISQLYLTKLSVTIALTSHLE